MKEKLYVVKKYAMATSVMDALKRERRTAADSCWVDDEWLKEQKEKAGNIQDVRGF